MIADAISEGLSEYNDVIERFGGQLGSEGRSIARVLISNKTPSVKS
jgi:hypothetical protein